MSTTHLTRTGFTLSTCFHSCSAVIVPSSMLKTTFAYSTDVATPNTPLLDYDEERLPFLHAQKSKWAAQSKGAMVYKKALGKKPQSAFLIFLEKHADWINEMWEADENVELRAMFPDRRVVHGKLSLAGRLWKSKELVPKEWREECVRLADELMKAHIKQKGQKVFFERQRKQVASFFKGQVNGEVLDKVTQIVIQRNLQFPVRPVNPYLMFVHKQMAMFRSSKSEYKSVDCAQFTQLAKNKWKELPEEERAMYQAQYMTAKAKFFQAKKDCLLVLRDLKDKVEAEQLYGSESESENP